MIKKYFQAGAILLSFIMIISACTSREDEISLNTQGFLDAYFKIDYKAASSFCTKELGDELSNSLKSLDSLEPTVRQLLEKQSKEVKTEIISVSTERGKDTATVLYKVILPSFPQGIENTISMVKLDKKWWVAALGN